MQTAAMKSKLIRFTPVCAGKAYNLPKKDKTFICENTLGGS